MGKSSHISSKSIIWCMTVVLVAAALCAFLYTQNEAIETSYEARREGMWGPAENESSLQDELDAYGEATSHFTPVTVGEVGVKIDQGDDFYLYVGRLTCEWCRKLVPTLQQVSDDEGITIHYLDSTDTKRDPELAAFRETYGIETVPKIIHFKQDGSYAVFQIDWDRGEIAEQLAVQFDQ